MGKALSNIKQVVNFGFEVVVSKNIAANRAKIEEMIWKIEAASDGSSNRDVDGVTRPQQAHNFDLDFILNQKLTLDLEELSSQLAESAYSLSL